jgi:cytochrome c oxidase subunit 2
VNGNYGWGLPVAASTFAREIDSSLSIVHWVMAFIFVLWAVFFAYCLIRYRSRPGRLASYPAHSAKTTIASFVPDALVLAFEIWLIFIFGLPIWAHVKEVFPAPENSTHVRIVAQQFAWNIHYPGPDGKFGRTDPSLIDSTNPVGLDPKDPASADDLVVVNDLHVPLGKPALIELTSQDVIHSFFVPEFRIKQDVVPGMKIPLWVEPTMKGLFEIGCAQLCGVGHYRMRGDVHVESPEEFQAWYNGWKQVQEETKASAAKAAASTPWE